MRTMTIKTTKPVNHTTALRQRMWPPDVKDGVTGVARDILLAPTLPGCPDPQPREEGALVLGLERRV